MLYVNSETNLDLKSLLDQASTNDIWECLEDNYQAQVPFIESTINRWNDRTQLQQVQQKTQKSAFNATIVEQVN